MTVRINCDCESILFTDKDTITCANCGATYLIIWRSSGRVNS